MFRFGAALRVARSHLAASVGLREALQDVLQHAKHAWHDDLTQKGHHYIVDVVW